jgi:hypothetical protein
MSLLMTQLKIQTKDLANSGYLNRYKTIKRGDYNV